MSKYRIAVIVTWFGNLPPYFPAWINSAENNKDIDFLVFSDQDIVSESTNIKFNKMNMTDTIKMFEQNLNRNINIQNSYKFCDCRVYFGLAYADYLKDYDFWGYCDIDLVFGNIREFLTDEILSKYDRFYQYGHLSIYRNSERTNHLYDLPGGIYTEKEIFLGEAKTTPEEHFGINRICERNNISWYTQVDFADFAIKYPQRLEPKHGVQNYEDQIFVWHRGEALRFYRQNGVINQDSFVYMHWQKRKPVIDGIIEPDSYLVLCGDRIVSLPGTVDISSLDFSKYNPMITDKIRKECKKQYRRKKVNEFRRANMATKKMWLRQKFYKMIDGKHSYL